MLLDSERQREILLQLINASTFQGTAIEEIYWLRLAIVTAEITPIARET